MKHDYKEKHKAKHSKKHEGHKGHHEGAKEKIKEAHAADGHKAKHKMIKRARGGKVATPSSPISGAMPKGLPGEGKGVNAPVDKEND